jgi:hypothetical protein
LPRESTLFFIVTFPFFGATNLVLIGGEGPRYRQFG